MANPIGTFFFEGVFPFIARSVRSMFGQAEKKLVSQEAINAGEKGFVRDAATPPPVPKATEPGAAKATTTGPVADPYPAPEGVLKSTTINGQAPTNTQTVTLSNGAGAGAEVSGNFGYMGRQTRFGEPAATAETSTARTGAPIPPSDVRIVKPTGRGRDLLPLPGDPVNRIPVGRYSRDFVVVDTPSTPRMAVDVRGRSAPSLGQVTPYRDPGFTMPGTSTSRDLAVRPPVLEGEILPPVARSATPPKLPEAPVIDNAAPKSNTLRNVAIGAGVVAGVGVVGFGANKLMSGTPAVAEPERQPQQEARRDPPLPEGSGLRAYAENHSRAYARQHHNGAVPAGVEKNFNRSVDFAGKLFAAAGLPTNADADGKFSEQMKFAVATLAPTRLALQESLRANGVDKPISEIATALKDKDQRKALFEENPDLEKQMTAIAKSSGRTYTDRKGEVKWDQVSRVVGNKHFAGKLMEGDPNPQQLISEAKKPVTVAAAKMNTDVGQTDAPVSQPARQAQQAPRQPAPTR